MPSASSSKSASTKNYLVGIDLGTTHTVVAFVDLRKGLENVTPTLFEIEQLVAPGEVAKKPLLPSFRYHPAAGELADDDLVLPWQSDSLPGELLRMVVGEWARELGSKVDGRLVSSAKSWLSHPQVDRSAAILPWAAAEGVEKVSPVLASASYLSHVRSAWNHEHPEYLLEEQEVVITVPASFDEVARSLTVEAAALAGLPKILLLEEPQAVCYDWYAKHQQQAGQLLEKVRLLMVCDVGGGTTDLSLIKVATNNGELALTRVGVGDHLMLGGDNVDLALAHTAEQRISPGGKKLSAASLSQLIQQTRKAKEQLLSANPPGSAKVTVLGAGARLIGGAKSCDLSREEVHAVALDGFFPKIDFSERPDKRRSAVVEFGLPYAADPAVSKHLGEFIRRHDGVCRGALALGDDSSVAAIPDAILFNGGVFNSALLSERCLSVLTQWAGKPPQLLDNERPDLAVAFGAVAYGLARQGAQLKIGGGSARSYFLQVDQENEDLKQGVCLLPRGTEEGEAVRLAERKFALRVGQPVRFHLWSSTEDTLFEAGQLSLLEEARYVSLPPLVAALEGEGSKEVQVALETTLTEVGTLQIDCVSLADEQQRWHVEFEIRKDLAKKRQSGMPDVVLPARFDQALDKIEAVYGQSKKDADPKAVKTLRNHLEKLLGKRDEWDTPVLRELFAQFLAGTKRRRRSQAHERLWFNLAGFCLRPGFGYPLDDWRIEQIWPLYQQGLQFKQESQSWTSWWTFWRRAAGGLNTEQQMEIFTDIDRFLRPEANLNRQLQAELKGKSYEDIVRLAASLEHLPEETKVELGTWLLTRLEKTGETLTSWWALGRVASRIPFHGSAHNVIAAEQVETWLPQLLQADWKKHPHIGFSAVMMSRMSGDRSRDLDDATRQQIVDKLNAAKAPAIWLEMVETVKELSETETKRVFGEALPSGLKLLG